MEDEERALPRRSPIAAVGDLDRPRRLLMAAFRGGYDDGMAAGAVAPPTTNDPRGDADRLWPPGATSGARIGCRIPQFGECGEDLVDGGRLELRVVVAPAPELPLALFPPFAPVAVEVGEG